MTSFLFSAHRILAACDLVGSRYVGVLPGRAFGRANSFIIGLSMMMVELQELCESKGVGVDGAWGIPDKPSTESIYNRNQNYRRVLGDLEGGCLFLVPCCSAPKPEFLSPRLAALKHSLPRGGHVARTLPQTQ